MHLIDTTMFFCPRGGGVRRYLLAKQAWLQTHAPQIRHTLLVPHPQPGLANLDTCAALGLSLGNGYRFPLSRRGWREALLQRAPDLIEAGDPYIPGWVARDAGQRLGIPVAAFFHSDLPRMLRERIGAWTTRPAQAYLRRLYRGFDIVYAPSRIMLEKLESLGIGRTALQPLGVDTNVFHPACRNERLRMQLGLAPETRLLVYAGRFAREKRLDVLIGAAARLGRPYHLLLIGGDKLERLNAQVTVLPYEPVSVRLARLVASCDAFIHAGAEETFGLVLIEAMACGIPVIAVASGGLAELVDDDVGVLAPVSQAKALGEAVTALFERDMRALGAAARRRAEHLYSWDSAFLRLLRSYAHLRGERTASWAARRDVLLSVDRP